MSRVPVEVAASVVDEALARGFSLRDVSRSSGVPVSTLSALARRQRPHVSEATWRCLERCCFSRRVVAADRPRAQLEALRDAGWSRRRLSGLLGREARVRGARVEVRLATAIDELAGNLGLRLSPSLTVLTPPLSPHAVSRVAANAGC